MPEGNTGVTINNFIFIMCQMTSTFSMIGLLALALRNFSGLCNDIERYFMGTRFPLMNSL